MAVLKIIGMVILILLLIVLILLGLLLFVPVRYQVEGRYFGQPFFKAGIRFLPAGLHVNAKFENDTFVYTVRLLGGVVFTNTGKKLSWLGRKMQGEEPEPKAEEDRQEKKTTKEAGEVEVSGEFESANSVTENRNIQTVTETGKTQSSGENANTTKRTGHRSKARKQTGFHSFCSKIKHINKKKQELLRVRRSERFRVAWSDLKGYLKDIVRILKPDYLEGFVHFGMEDPADTGYILGILAMALPLYDEHFRVLPDFETQCLEGECKGKGKIYVCSVLWLLIRIIRNKNLIKVKNKVQTIIEA